jgi:hypothetical protein
MSRLIISTAMTVDGVISVEDSYVPGPRPSTRVSRFSATGRLRVSRQPAERSLLVIPLVNVVHAAVPSHADEEDAR